MISQAKTLKKILKKYDFKDAFGKLSVRTEIYYRNVRGYKFQEYGNAKAHIRHLTDGEVELLKAESIYLKVSNHYIKENGHGFAIITY